MRSLWMNPEDVTYPALVGETHADVCIIGAGFSGIGAARALRDSGARVVVLEDRTVASGATGRNAGFVLAGPAAGYDDAIRTLGREATHEIWQLTIDNNQQIAELVEELGLDCGYLRRGSMSLAATEHQWDSLQRVCALLRVEEIEVCIVPAHNLPKPFDCLYQGGLYYAGNAEIQPAAFTRGVAGTLRPGSVFELTHDTGLEPSYDGWRVTTDGGFVFASTVILATNAYTQCFLPEAPIVPIRGQVLSTVPLDRVVVPFPMYADLGYQYWRQTPEGRLVVGGWRNLDIAGEVGRQEILNSAIQDALIAFVAHATGSEPTVEHRWAGIMGFTPDMAPLVGAVPNADGLYMAAGYSGHGVAMAFTCGARVASLAIGDPARLPAAFDPGRFRT